MSFSQVDGNQNKADEIMDRIEQGLDSSAQVDVKIEKGASEAMKFRKGQSLVDKLKALAAQEDFGDEHLGEPEKGVTEGYLDSPEFKSRFINNADYSLYKKVDEALDALKQEPDKLLNLHDLGKTFGWSYQDLVGYLKNKFPGQFIWVELAGKSGNIKAKEPPLKKVSSTTENIETKYSESEMNVEPPKTGIYGDVTQNQSAAEDTVKQGGSWVNKGKEGTHGKFRTKKAADAQRKAMFAKGYQATEEMDEYELATALNNLIRDEYEAIDGYNDMISDLEENEQNEDIIPVLTDINNEENTHVGQLQEALKTVSPAADHIAKGEVEAEGQLKGREAMEEYKEEMYGFEAMSTPDLEAFQAVIADQLDKEGSISTLEKLIDKDLTFDFTEQINYIKNTSDLSNTNEVLNEILKAAETLLDDIQVETLVEELSKDELEEPDEMADQEFEEYQEPEDWSKVDETEEVVEEEPIGEETV